MERCQVMSEEEPTPVVTVIDALTGKSHMVPGITAWGWMEGNWSCDCNRCPPELRGVVQDDPCRAERFVVVA